MSESERVNTGENRTDLPSRIDDLPELKEGFVRLIHGTSESIAQKIVREGLDYSKQGMIDSTARAYADASDIEYYTDDPRFSYEGAKSVIMDVPFDEYRLHRNITRSPGLIPSKYIVGVIDAHRPAE